MLILTRTVRFAINPGEWGAGANSGGPNGYAGSPPVRGLGRHYAVSVTCAGVADPVTGYLLNIKEIDRAVRTGAVPIIARACEEQPGIEASLLLPDLAAAIAKGLPAGMLRAVRWYLSPYHSVEMGT